MQKHLINDYTYIPTHHYTGSCWIFTLAVFHGTEIELHF